MLQIGGTVCSEGDKLTLNRRAEVDGFGTRGDTATIKEIIQNSGENTVIVVVKDQAHSSWRRGHTLKFGINNLRRYFTIDSQLKELYVSGKFVYKGKDLRGKKCKPLAVVGNSDYIVEFAEDIGGCSGDGLGKLGHCVAVDKKLLKSKKRKTKAKGESNG